MKIIHTNLKDKLNINEELTVGIGNFDGIHLGHQKLINEVIKYTNNAIITFNPNPKELINNEYKFLLDYNDKIKLFEKYNIKYLIVINTTLMILNKSKYEFINWLKINNIKKVIIGKNFSFGYKGQGNYNDLKDFELIIIPYYYYKNKEISSTRIKEEIINNNFKEANIMLDKEYYIKGIIGHGNKVGRTLGFPTANLIYNNYVVPNKGVYITDIIIDNKRYNSITNIGNNPTINTQKELKIETYILNFNEYIYEYEVRLIFKEKIRNEVKFNNINELINQMNEDVKKALDYNYKRIKI